MVSVDPANPDNTEYAVRLSNSNLSLNYLEEILYHRNCMKVYMDKTFESMQGMMSRISVLENELREQSDSNKASEKNYKKEEIDEENKSNISKLKDILSMQLESSESFRQNTERTLSKIKEEFELIVSEFDEIKRLDSQRVIHNKKFEKERDSSGRVESGQTRVNNTQQQNYYNIMSLTSRSKNTNPNFNKANETGSPNKKIEPNAKKGPIFNINLNSLTINNNVNNTNLNLQGQAQKEAEKGGKTGKEGNRVDPTIPRLKLEK